MKTILVDAINGLYVKADGTAHLFEAMHKMLEAFPNPKVILTGADEKDVEKFNLHNPPYELFTLKHDPEKSDPAYYQKMLEHFELSANNVVYFEHAEPAVESARSVGINAYHYNHEVQDLDALRGWLEENL